MMKSIHKKAVVLTVFLLIALIFATFFDYQIAHSLYNKQSIVSKIVDILAELPTYLMMTLFSATLYVTRNKDGSFLSAFSAVLGIISMIFFGFLTGYTLLFNMNLYSPPLIYASAIGVCVCALVLSRIAADKSMVTIRKISKIGLLSFFSTVAIILVLHFCFERIPYIRIDNSINIYTPWYQFVFLPDVLSYEVRTFPSLTMGIASMTFMMNQISEVVVKYQQKKLILMIITLSWIFIVGISQIIMGEAYLSDVIFSILIGMLMITIHYLLIFKRKSKKEKTVE